MGLLIGVAYGLSRSSAILKKGEGAMADDFFRKGMRGALGWSMAVGAVSAHAARPLGDAEVWAFASFAFDNKAFGEVKICACRVRGVCAHENKGLRS